MNVYDWDKTIYDGDSSIDFYKHCLKKYPSISKYWPRQMRAMSQYKRRKITKTEMKTVFYEYFQSIPNIGQEVQIFWDENEHKIKSWYYDQKRDDDLIISASPDFLLRPITNKLGIALIASDVNPLSGENMQENCYGPEKVRRMKLEYDINEMEEFYSDSYSDDPLAQFAQKSYLVKGNERLPW